MVKDAVLINLKEYFFSITSKQYRHFSKVCIYSPFLSGGCARHEYITHKRRQSKHTALLTVTLVWLSSAELPVGFEMNASFLCMLDLASTLLFWMFAPQLSV